jgi:hypothetical protein
MSESTKTPHTTAIEWDTASFADKLDTIYVQFFKPVLEDKNKQYGNAALKPIDFLNINPQAYGIIRSRLNEKLNRLQALTSEENPENLESQAAAIEDTLMDVSGYWFLQSIEVVGLKLAAAQNVVSQSKNDADAES